MNDKTTKRLSFIINAAYLTIIALIVYLVITRVIEWVLPFLLAFILVTLIHPVIRQIKKMMKIKIEIVSICVMLLIYAIVGVLLFTLIFNLVYLLISLFKGLPPYYAEYIEPAFQTLGATFSGFVGELPPQFQEQLIAIQSDIGSTVYNFLITLSQKGLAFATGFAGSIPSFVIGLVFTIMLSFFISMQYSRVIVFMKLQLPQRVQDILFDVKAILVDTVFKYLRAAVTIAIITFAELAIGLLVLRVDNAIPVAVGIALFDALPFFGTGAVMIPWMVIEAIQGNYTLAAGLLALYLIIAFIRNIIEPKIVGDKLGMNPIVSLTAIYLGFRVLNVPGMILMPILVQTLLALHKKGNIRLFKSAVVPDAPDSPDEVEPPETQ